MQIPTDLLPDGAFLQSGAVCLPLRTWLIGFYAQLLFADLLLRALQSGVNAESLSHEDYLNAPGQKVSSKFTEPGEYSYYCEPHQGAGMAGKVIVQ